jgi:MscS family membrane protein
VLSRHASLAALFFALTTAGPARAQAPAPAPEQPAPAAPPAAAGTEVAAGSPRSAVEEFLLLTRQGKNEEAARFLAPPATLESQAPRLARQLKLVLDRHLWIDLEALSPLPGGLSDDGLPPDVEEIGSVPGAGGKPEPVRLVRKRVDGDSTWVFSSPTVSRVPAWYRALDNRPFLDHLPPQLLRSGPKDLLWWQWIAVVVLFLPAWWGGRFLGWATRKVLLRAAARTSTPWDEALLLRMRGPFTLAWTLVLLRAGLPFLGLYAPAEAFAVQVLKSGAILAFFWAAIRGVTVAGDVLASASWATTNPGARSFLHFTVQVGRVFVFAMGVLAALSALGIPVNSVLAGLGIGGIAIAFAAQKTVENFFGAVSIGVDQPLRVGDFVKVDSTLGTVEKMGLRSTRLRTLDRTIVTIPNGKLADMQIETFAERDRIRMAAVVGLEYGTTSAQLRAVISEIEALLRAHPKIWPDVIVRFVAFGPSSLDLDVWAWFQTTDFAEFRDIRQEVLVGVMEVVEKNGCSFAFPTRTVHLVGPGAAQPSR